MELKESHVNSKTSQIISIILCAGLITLLSIGSLCVKDPGIGLCGPAGKDGGIAMVTVGAIFLGVQVVLSIILCLCACGLAAFSEFTK